MSVLQFFSNFET